MESRKVARLFHGESRRTVLIPLDHGLAQGPIDGLSDLPKLLSELADADVDAVVLNPGMAASCADSLAHHPDLGLIVHLSAGSGLAQHVKRRSVVAAVDSALPLGADAVSVHLNVGADDDIPQLRELAATSARCRVVGMPLLAMMYLADGTTKVDRLAHAARMAAELGADIVKIPYPGEVGLRAIVESVPRPIVCAGGRIGGATVAEIVTAVRRSGAAGVAIGRQVFGASDPAAAARELVTSVHARTNRSSAHLAARARAGASPSQVGA